MSDPPREVRLRTVRSFVRREGRLTAAQARALETLLPRLQLPIAGAIEPAGLFGNRNPLCLEIGTGNGENLFEAARTRPGFNHLAVEVHRPGVGQLLMLVEQAGLSNVRVSIEDVHQVLARLPAESLQEVAIYFPDPWPKSRHHKRRLLKPEFLAALHRCVRRGGRVFIATDIDDYADGILDALKRSPGWINLAGTAGLGPRPRQRCLTRFERRALREGRVPREFVIARVD